MRRWLLIGFFLVLGSVAADQVVAWVRGTRPVVPVLSLIEKSRPPILVGLIHSQTGPLKISEQSLLDAEIMALEEINARGGIGGQPLRWEIADGRSDSTTFAEQARRLIEREQAKVLVGGWTAECRKAMVAVVEEHHSLLIFPANFEGIERSPSVIYSGGSMNQVIVPAVRWCGDALKAKRFFVIGTEEVSSRCGSEIAKDAVKAASGEIAGETYLPLTVGDASTVIEALRTSKPDIVLNLLIGESNGGFFKALHRAGLTSEKLPVMSFNVAEDELRRFEAGDLTGHYSAWSYFQSVDRPENREFIRKFKARPNNADRVISDSMVAAYNGIMIWAQAANEEGSGEPLGVLEHLDRQSIDAPEGVVTIDPESHAAWRPFHVGKARADGQFDLVWSISKPIHPETYVGTRTKPQWNALLKELNAGWNGRWSSSEPIHPNPTPPPR